MVIKSSWTASGVPRAHQRITTLVVQGIAPNSPRCASCAPMNYNDPKFASLANSRKVRLARTNELQQVLLGQKQVLSGCASRAPMNYNTGRPDNPYIEDGAPRVYQRITTSRSPATGRRRSRCASRAPTNYNGQRAETASGMGGAPRARPRITTHLPAISSSSYTRCTSLVPTNYNALLIPVLTTTT